MTDIYRAAHEYIKQYGDDADIQAAMMADKMLERVSMEGPSLWLQIMAAIDELGAWVGPDAFRVWWHERAVNFHIRHRNFFLIIR